MALAGGLGMAATLRLPAEAGADPGASATVTLSVDDATGILGTDLVITYDPAVAAPAAVAGSMVAADHVLTANLSQPGIVRISLYGTSSLDGSGALLEIFFGSVGPSGSRTVLHFSSADLNEGAIPVALVDGQYCVQGLAAPAQNLLATTSPGDSTMNLSWDAHPFALAYNLYRGTRSDLGDLGCFLGALPGTVTVDDGAVPPVGGMFLYLLTARTCAGESSAGLDSSGAQRPAPPVCP